VKIIFVDTAVSGHHLTYLSALLSSVKDAVLILPEKIETIKKKQYICSLSSKRDLCVYWKWIHQICDIVKKEKPDIVHFLYGDDLYRYFGWGLSTITCRVIVTLHQVRHSRLRDISLKLIAKAVDTVVVHTNKIRCDLENSGVNNIVHIEYPKFNKLTNVDKKVAQAKIGITSQAPVLIALGGTRTDKGLDILLEALNRVNRPYHLIIAGKEEDIHLNVIMEKTAAYRNYVTTFLEFLSDEKMSYCLSASDIVVLPYRKSFDGASGPLGEGVALGKVIVGADHGSLGDLICKNHLGYTFESENDESLAAVLNIALTSVFEKDDVYRKYQDSLGVDSFLKKYEAVYKKCM